MLRRVPLCAFLCALMSLSGAAPGVGAAPGAAGTWTGALESADGEVVELTVRLERSPEGFWIGTLDAPGWQAQAAPLEALSVSAGIVRFSATGLPGAPEFVGRLSADGAEITGDVFLDPPPPPPASDVYLIELETDGGFWKLGDPVNITDRDGYDNQPRFLFDSSALLYTSIRDGQADVYRYDLAGRTSARLTETGESEYSPTPLPSGSGFSTVRVEDDGTQRLWSFDARGQSPALLLPEIQPVGYHGWLDQRRLGLFVLGSPPTLELADVVAQTRRTVADGIGRSIHRTPDGLAVSFVHKGSETEWTIDRLELDSGERRTLVATRAGSEDFAWAPDGRIVMGEDGALYACSPDARPPAWQQVADLSLHGITGITRLDVSADGRWLAVVGARPSAGPPPERIRTPFALRAELR